MSDSNRNLVKGSGGGLGFDVAGTMQVRIQIISNGTTASEVVVDLDEQSRFDMDDDAYFPTIGSFETHMPVRRVTRMDRGDLTLKLSDYAQIDFGGEPSR